MRSRAIALLPLLLILTAGPARADETNGIGEVRSFRHLSHDEIVQGIIPFPQVLEHGELLFVTPLTRLDGQGRPATTGGGAKRVPDQPAFVRTSGPEASSCAGCHAQPYPGGAGDFVANVFVLAQTLDPVTFSVSPEVSNERNTLGMNGSGAIEILAREMTEDLRAARADAVAEAAATGTSVTRSLVSKGIGFGALTAAPDGSVDATAVEGVDSDLIVRPFHQKGVVTSLREFTNNAFNHHHGMQSVERFGVARTGETDFDEDGVEDELSEGDITAVTLWQAALPVPGRVLSRDPVRQAAVVLGEERFAEIGCAGCHVPALPLRDRRFCEPSPWNPPGNLGDTSRSVCFDLAREGLRPGVEARGLGGAVVRAYTDLKRHNLCDAELDHFCNERIVQAGVPTELFLTRKLWDVGNTAPYGHRGDLTTITEAIEQHGGEARVSRDAFLGLAQGERDAVVEFLKSLQILPEGSPRVIHR